MIGASPPKSIKSLLEKLFVDSFASSLGIGSKESCELSFSFIDQFTCSLYITSLVLLVHCNDDTSTSYRTRTRGVLSLYTHLSLKVIFENLPILLSSLERSLIEYKTYDSILFFYVWHRRPILLEKEWHSTNRGTDNSEREERRVIHINDCLYSEHRCKEVTHGRLT